MDWNKELKEARWGAKSEVLSEAARIAEGNIGLIVSRISVLDNDRVEYTLFTDAIEPDWSAFVQRARVISEPRARIAHFDALYNHARCAAYILVEGVAKRVCIAFGQEDGFPELISPPQPDVASASVRRMAGVAYATTGVVEIGDREYDELRKAWKEREGLEEQVAGVATYCEEVVLENLELIKELRHTLQQLRGGVRHMETAIVHFRNWERHLVKVLYAEGEPTDGVQ